MSSVNCRMCSYKIDLTDEEYIMYCPNCGMKLVLPQVNNARRADMYDRANKFRIEGDYQRAQGIVDRLIEEDKTDGEAYWLCLLCKYKVQYMYDPSSKKWRIRADSLGTHSIFDDPIYKQALENSTREQQETYANEAHVIHQLQTVKWESDAEDSLNNVNDLPFADAPIDYEAAKSFFLRRETGFLKK